MRRRDFIKVISGGAAMWPLSARAQQPTMPVVGYLSAGTSSGDARLVAAFVKGLGETGYQDGKTVQIEYRWAENQYDRLSSIAADLVRQKVAVIAAVSTPAARDPVECGGRTEAPGIAAWGCAFGHHHRSSP